MTSWSSWSKNLAPMILIRSTGAPEELLQLIHVASFHVLASHFLISASSFCPPSFTHGPCNYCSFEFRPRGTMLESIFAGCFRSLFTNPFPAYRASRWLRHLFPLKKYSCPKFVSDDVFPMKKAKIKPVIRSRPISTFFLFSK